MDKERFGLKKGRQRPPYKPKDMHCPSCGAGLTVKDERSELVVCDYCGSHLDVSKEEKTVLGKGSGKKWEFPLQLGDSFFRKTSKFEIIGRMAFIEDGDYDELTRQYLLYNPRRGTIWLDEYQGQYSISGDSHVMPTSDPFAKRRGDTLKTYDKREWVTEGTGTYELVYVDGSLPWLAKVGDESDYAEFSEKSGSGKQYEVQRIANEIEYGSGETLSIRAVRQATGKADLGGKAIPKTARRAAGVGKPQDAANTRKWFLSIIVVAVVTLLISGALNLYCRSTGRLVLDQSFFAEQLNTEATSNPFDVKNANDVIKVVVRANVSNAWMALDVGIIKGEDAVIHVYGSDISYYNGVEGGESWSEGSQSASTYIKIPDPGAYRLLVHAVSARGNATSASQAIHDVRIRVYSGALVPQFSFISGVLSLIILVPTSWAYRRWKEQE